MGDRVYRINWSRVALATIVANLTTLLALGLLFGNSLVERILYTDQAGQSAKVLSVFFEQEPLVGLELALQLVAMALTGVVIALIYRPAAVGR